MEKIIVKNCLYNKCPNCFNTVWISNENELLYLNVSTIHIVKESGKIIHKIKCKQP